MIDVKLIEEDTEKVITNLKKRNFDISLINSVVELNSQRKDLITSMEAKRSEVKSLSKEIGPIKQSGGDASELMAKVADVKKSIELENTKLEEIVSKRDDILLGIPNLISSDTPEGKDESDNLEIMRKGSIPKFDFKAKEHHELGENLGMLDFERGARLTGSRFVVYKGHLAQMERALINFMLDQHFDHGYEEIIPPFIVNRETLVGTGQLPKFEDDLFKLEGRDWYLIPTAEVPLTNLKKQELFEKSELPLKYTAFTPCFRSEAGSYGKDTKGLIRLHQFNKVELVNIVEPTQSNNAHEDMIERATSLLEALELPYRGVVLCSGDIGFGARKTIDLEVWLPGQDTFREISSISNCGDFQARRAGIRFRGASGKPEFAHTLNGSGLAVGRTMVAIMENYQQADGSIIIPRVLQPYMRGLEVIKAQ